MSIMVNGDTISYRLLPAMIETKPFGLNCHPILCFTFQPESTELVNDEI